MYSKLNTTPPTLADRLKALRRPDINLSPYIKIIDEKLVLASFNCYCMELDYTDLSIIAKSNKLLTSLDILIDELIDYYASRYVSVTRKDKYLTFGWDNADITLSTLKKNYEGNLNIDNIISNIIKRLEKTALKHNELKITTHILFKYRPLVLTTKVQTCIMYKLIKYFTSPEQNIKVTPLSDDSKYINELLFSW